MVATPDFDIQQAHVFFSTECFNQTWAQIDKGATRSNAEAAEMLHTAIASLWHWSQRQDVSAQNLSISYWQVSRVYCLLKQPQNARRYGIQALEYAQTLAPFYKGYAYETLARAEMLDNNRAIMKTHLENAHAMLALVTDEEDRALLAQDLEALR